MPSEESVSARDQAQIDWSQVMQQQSVLKPDGDTRATLQFFADIPEDRVNPARRSELAKVLHGDLADPAFRAVIQRRHTAGAGSFIIVNPTDLRGRRDNNIIEARCAFLDADVSKGQGDSYRRFMETPGLVATIVIE